MMTIHSLSIIKIRDERMAEVSDAELLSVIKDFLEMGHVENIAAMFYQEPGYLEWTGAILDDERFNVRLGVSVLFEELQARKCTHLVRAVDSLKKLLESDQPLLRGEALSVLAIINGPDLQTIAEKMRGDADPQVREISADILEIL